MPLQKTPVFLNILFCGKAPPPLIHALNYNPIKDKAVCVRGLGPLINSVNKNLIFLK